MCMLMQLTGFLWPKSGFSLWEPWICVEIVVPIHKLDAETLNTFDMLVELEPKTEDLSYTSSVELEYL